MSNELIINSRPHQTRVALVENGVVVELHIERKTGQELMGVFPLDLPPQIFETRGFWLEIEGSHYWITQTQYEPAGFARHAQPTWLVGIHYDPGCLYVWRLRRRPRPGDLPRIAQAVHALLVSEPTINGIQWWAQDVGNGTPSSVPPPT